MVGGKRRRMGVCFSPNVSMVGAREKARETLGTIESGADPLPRASASALRAQQALGFTFDAASART